MWGSCWYTHQHAFQLGSPSQAQSHQVEWCSGFHFETQAIPPWLEPAMVKTGLLLWKNLIYWGNPINYTHQHAFQLGSPSQAQSHQVEWCSGFHFETQAIPPWLEPAIVKTGLLLWKNLIYWGNPINYYIYPLL